MNARHKGVVVLGLFGLSALAAGLGVQFGWAYAAMIVGSFFLFVAWCAI